MRSTATARSHDEDGDLWVGLANAFLPSVSFWLGFVNPLFWLGMLAMLAFLVWSAR